MENNSFFYIDQKVAESFFRESLETKNVYRVLNIYGKNGIGKSTFLEHLERKYLQNSKNLVYIKIDFANRLMHNPNYAIMYIAKELENRYDYDFISLWKAYAILWQKRYDNSLIMYAHDLPYIHEIKKLLNFDKKGKSFIKIIKGLFKDNIYKELERLKDKDSKDISKKLFFFFAQDFKNMLKVKELKDSIFLIDNYDILDEKNYSSPCKKDYWIRELVSYLGKNTLFVINSTKKINWPNCNIAFKNNVKSYQLTPFSQSDAKSYLRHYRIIQDSLVDAIITLSNKEASLLAIAKEAYCIDSTKKIPVVIEEIYEAFFESLNIDEYRLLEILSFVRTIDKDIIFNIVKNFDIKLSYKEIELFLERDFFKKISKNSYYIISTLNKKVKEHCSISKKKEYLSFIFTYYENILHNLDKEVIKNTPELIDKTLEEAWYYLRLMNKDINKYLDWLNYYVSRFFMYAAWEAFIDKYLEILPEIKNNSSSKENLAFVYNNLAGLYESIGEKKLAKEFYKKFAVLNRPQKLTA